MEEKESIKNITLLNSGLSTSLSQAMANLEKFNFKYPEIPELAIAALRIQQMMEPFKKFQNQINSYLSVFNNPQFQSIAFKHAETIKRLSQVNSVPFAQIAEKLNTNFDKLRILDFDLYADLEEEKFESPAIISEISDIKKSIQKIYEDNQFLYKLKSRKFEEVIAELLFNRGFEVELTKQTRDNGYDIIALNKINGFPNKYLVECKKYAANRPIGIDIIRCFCDVIKEEKANKGIIFTTSYFTKPSEDRKKKEGHLLDFVNRDDLLDWVKDYLKIDKK